MFDFSDVQKILSSRKNDISKTEDSGVVLSGSWQLRELQALIAFLLKENYDLLTLEEYVAEDYEVPRPIMPLVKLEVLVGSSLEKIQAAVAEEILDDVNQINNKGSVPVHGTQIGDSALEFSIGTITEISTEKLSFYTNELIIALSGLGVSKSTQILAAGMLYSSVFPREQECAVKILETKYLK